MIDTEARLAEFLCRLKAASWVAVDTEADSLHAYPEKVCLIQISTVAGDELVDPLSGVELDPLLDALAAHELIMHGADYDLRLLRKHHEFVPGAIFDTMLAARLLGLRQFGLGNLVEHFLGIQLEKGAQKADWAMRPLTEKMERYARNDTHYLKGVSDELRGQLKNKGRLEWHEESCARLIAESTREPQTDPDAWRIKGSHLLGRPGLAVLRELWQWREGEAIAADKPPFFVLSHQVLVDVAAAAVSNRQVEPLLPRHLSDRRRRELAKAVKRGLAVPGSEYPDIPRNSGRRANETEKKRFLELQSRRDARARELEIDPTLIASRSVLSDLAHNLDKNAPFLMKWQRELLTR